MSIKTSSTSPWIKKHLDQLRQQNIKGREEESKLVSKVYVILLPFSFSRLCNIIIFFFNLFLL